MILSLSKTVTFRDSQSAKLATEIRNRQYGLGGDLFLLTNIDRSQRTRVDSTALAVFGVYNLTEGVVNTLSNKIKVLYEFGIIDRVLFVPFHKGRKNDNIFHQKVAKGLPFGIVKEYVEYNSLGNLCSLLEGFGMLSLSRLHSVVLYDLLGIKSLPLEYSPKVKFYSESVGKRSYELDSFDDVDIREGMFELASESLLQQQIAKVELSIVNTERDVL